MYKHQKKNFGFFRKLFAVLVLMLPFLLVIVYEIRTNELEATFFNWYSRDLSWEVKKGESQEISFPGDGPYDIGLGYSRLPNFQKKLEASGYAVTAQARQSKKTLYLSRQGVPIPYDKKANAGLRLNEAHGAQFYYINLDEERFTSFPSIPPLLITLLLHRENRELFDFSRPFLNPAIEWDRFARACFGYLGEKFFTMPGGVGGSTLATQIIKFRHSSKGLTSGPEDKVRQMLGASIWAYQKNPKTIGVRMEIVKEYMNGMPLGAAPGLGEINGIGNGMWAWFGKTPKQLLGDLTLPETSPEKVYKKAKTLKEAFSLIVATRYPSLYLQNDLSVLDKEVNSYLKLLEKDRVITPALKNAAQAIPLKFYPGAPLPSPFCLLERKGRNIVRSRLLETLDVKTFYELDRLDLTVETTLDFETQQKVNTILSALYDPAFLQEKGFIAPYLLDNGDPQRVIYSFALYESTPEGNFLRIQTDTLNRPLNITTGIKLELGSTAKLRTLATYLMVIDHLDDCFVREDPSKRTVPADRLSRWVSEYRLEHPEATREEVLKASLQREISANPHRSFFTGGGLHVFKNFKEEQDDKVYTIEEGLCQSVNLVFIRLMKELVGYYSASLGYHKKELLDNPRDPRRALLLREAAELESVEFLKKYFQVYKAKPYAESLAMLRQSAQHPIRNWALLYLKENPDVSFETFTAQVQSLFGRDTLDAVYLHKLFKSYRGKSYSLTDEAYLLGKHPLEVWIVFYFKNHPHAPWREALAASAEARKLSSSWLFKTQFPNAQNLRIRSLLEKKAFAEILLNWKSLGYPFEHLVPSLATAIGSSGDRPANLAELMGIILDDGLYKPLVSIKKLHFAQDTPYETHFVKAPDLQKRVISTPVARVLKEAVKQVVERGTAQRIKNTFVNSDGTLLEVGGKTGTGDNRFETFRGNAAVVSSKIISRTSTFVFFAGRFFGIVTAHVEGAEASEYDFTSALAVQTLKTLWPALEPLFQPETTRTS